MIFPPRAYVFFTLNAIRFLSIVSLLLVFSSNIVIMANDLKAVIHADKLGAAALDSTEDEYYDCDYVEGSTVPNQAAGPFWATLNRLFIISASVLLILSEVGWPASFFTNYFPVLGPDFGVGILGGIQWFLAASILSHHVDSFPLVSAFFMFSVACLNILLGLIFRASVKSKRSITTFRDTKPKEFLPVSGPTGQYKVLETSVTSIFSRHDDEKAYRGFASGSNGGVDRHDTGSNGSAGTYGFGRQGEKQAGLKGFILSRPVDSLPRYAPRPPNSFGSSDRGRSPRSSRSNSPEPQDHVRTPSPPPPSTLPSRSSPRRI